MKSVVLFTLPLLLLPSLSQAVEVQVGTTSPVGYKVINCPQNSDTIVSVPFIDDKQSIKAAVSGTVTLAGTSPDNTVTFQTAGADPYTVDQFKDFYYVRFTTGLLEGSVYQISTNTAAEMTINLDGDNGGLIAEGDEFRIYKFWTLDTLFPPATQYTFESSPTAFMTLAYSLLMTYDKGLGINRAPSNSYYIFEGVWRKVGSSNPVGETILWPDDPIIVRHNGNVSKNTKYMPNGYVDFHRKFSIPLLTQTDSQRDNYISIPRPVDVKLKDLGLIESGAFVISTGNRAYQRGDQLFMYDNELIAHNKSASRIYFHNGTNWVRNSDLQNADDDVLKAADGFVIRKKATAGGGTVIWDNFPTYPVQE